MYFILTFSLLLCFATHLTLKINKVHQAVCVLLLCQMQTRSIYFRVCRKRAIRVDCTFAATVMYRLNATCDSVCRTSTWPNGECVRFGAGRSGGSALGRVSPGSCKLVLHVAFLPGAWCVEGNTTETQKGKTSQTIPDIYKLNRCATRPL